MAVLELVKYNARETINVLRALLAMAIRGELRGLAICYRRPDGSEESLYTGAYKANPSLASSASLRMSLAIMRANGEIE